MNRSTERQPMPPALSALELEQRIAATERRMAHRRRSLQLAWDEIEHQMEQALSPRAWLRPFVLGLLGGSLLGLLWWQRGRSRSGRGGGSPAGTAAGQRGHRLAQRQRGQPWLRPLLALALQQWLQPTLMRTLERLLPTLLASLLAPGNKPAATRRPPPRDHNP